MTFFEVLDDAVKIGLGAVLAIIGASLGHRREWKRERARRHLDFLERTAKDFESAHNTFLDYVVAKQVAKRSGEAFQGSSDTPGATRRAVLELVAVITVVASPNTELAIRKYAVAVSACLSACGSDKSIDDLERAGDALENARRDFHKALRAEYVAAK